MHIAIVWQRFLPYHLARLAHTYKYMKKLGNQFTAIEVAHQEASYGFPQNYSNSDFPKICCFPEGFYHQYTSQQIFHRVFLSLRHLNPDIILAPATAFPEGMAAVHYRNVYKKRVVMMDDAWEYSDCRGLITRWVKQLIHQNIDAAFIPSPSHLNYYIKRGFPKERIVFGVDVVDNEYFRSKAEIVRAECIKIRREKNLPENYFLFVGRFLPRKGLDNLIIAYKKYYFSSNNEPWSLVLVGSGTYLPTIQKNIRDIPGIIYSGPQFGNDLVVYYSLAKTLIVPSFIDPWGLVINEAMASGIPILASHGCGASRTLIREGQNGWTFDPFDTGNLADLMIRVASLPKNEITAMGKKSQDIIGEWSLDRFLSGVLKAISLSRRRNAGVLSIFATKFWKGKVSVL